MEKSILKIGIIGLGTVGSGVFKTLKNFDNIEIVKIAVKNINKKRDIEGLDNSILTDNAYDVVNNPEIDIVAELVGGIEPAFDLISTAIKNGKQRRADQETKIHCVTARHTRHGSADKRDDYGNDEHGEKSPPHLAFNRQRMLLHAVTQQHGDTAQNNRNEDCNGQLNKYLD